MLILDIEIENMIPLTFAPCDDWSLLGPASPNFSGRQAKFIHKPLRDKYRIHEIY